MNSLTVNNRLPQLRGIPVPGFPLFRYERMVSGRWVPCNHSRAKGIVGVFYRRAKLSCENLTDGSKITVASQSGLSVGNRKHNALSICGKDINMSVLALCGNSGVILLSVKRQEHIDSAIPGRYTVQAPHKAGAGIGVLELHTATMGALASFLLLQLSYTQIMVGWVGAPKGAPVSVCAGYANPAQFTTSEIGVSGGGSYPLHTEAAIMATIPALVQPELCIIADKVVTSSLAVASYFGKQHKNVIQKIASLECSAEFTKLNFQLSEYIDASGRKLPCYQITRDGFAFLAMGFTGKRAAQFKEAYINAFNQMEKQLSKLSVLSDAAHNASVLYSYISSIHQVWLQQLYPMLEKAESPLAVSLHDRINDAAALASLINMTLNRSEVRGRK
ncbi:peptidase [Salmonella enterica subsp. salamae]|nr:peptidase [Salmonella enterica subsp. salamae]EEI9682750.1 peptidase [Salmonella enterica]